MTGGAIVATLFSTPSPPEGPTVRPRVGSQFIQASRRRAMTPKLGETIVLSITFSGGDGAKVDVTSPGVLIFEDTNDTPILTLTPVKRGSYTGLYRVSVACTTGNGFEADKSYNAIAQGTLDGVPIQGTATDFQVRPLVEKATPAAQDGTLYPVDPTGPAEYAAAVWNEPRTGHTTSGTFGFYLDASVSAGGSVVVDGGTVSASPSPTTTGFTATGSALHSPTDGYTVAPMWVHWQSGANQGIKSAISAHTKSGSNHAFVIAALPAPPSSGDTFIIV